MTWLLLDTNVLLLLVVGRAGRHLIDNHKRLRSGYAIEDYDLLESLLAGSNGLIVVPQVLAEVSKSARQIGSPAKRAVTEALGRMVDEAAEVYRPSKAVVSSAGFDVEGLTDCILLQLCSEDWDGGALTLVTADRSLAYRAEALGNPVLHYLTR